MRTCVSVPGFSSKGFCWYYKVTGFRVQLTARVSGALLGKAESIRHGKFAVDPLIIV